MCQTLLLRIGLESYCVGIKTKVGLLKNQCFTLLMEKDSTKSVRIVEKNLMNDLYHMTNAHFGSIPIYLVYKKWL